MFITVKKILNNDFKMGEEIIAVKDIKSVRPFLLTDDQLEKSKPQGIENACVIKLAGSEKEIRITNDFDEMKNLLSILNPDA
jgi:hypothetical protein